MYDIPRADRPTVLVSTDHKYSSVLPTEIAAARGHPCTHAARALCIAATFTLFEDRL